MKHTNESIDRLDLIYKMCVIYNVPLWVMVGKDREWKLFYRHMWE